MKIKSLGALRDASYMYLENRKQSNLCLGNFQDSNAE